MAGYNTFCEILSLDKRAILIPRVKPRREQLLRAQRAAALGLVRMLDPEGVHDPAVMASALRGLALQPLPSERGAGQMLDGLPLITDLVADLAGGATFTKVRAAGRLIGSSRRRLSVRRPRSSRPSSARPCQRSFSTSSTCWGSAT